MSIVDQIYSSAEISYEDQPVFVGGSAVFWFTKRTADILLSLILFPLILVIGCVIILFNVFFNSGPLLYYQVRYGKKLEEFKMLKFRTMIGVNEGSKFATDEKERITQFGSFLRATHIDELPQVWNVLKGDMSIIGPRPEQKRFVHEYLKSIPSYEDRHSVRPGVTGLAQVEQGYTSTHQGTRSKLRYDMFYIRHSGFLLESSIILKTVRLLAVQFVSKIAVWAKRNAKKVFQS